MNRVTLVDVWGGVDDMKGGLHMQHVLEVNVNLFKRMKDVKKDALLYGI